MSSIVGPLKGQLISKANYQAKNSSKNERMNSFLLVCNVFSFVFWKKLKAPKRHFEIIWPLPNLTFPIYSFQHSMLLLWLCSGITKLSMAWTRSFYLSWGHVPWCQCDNTPIMIEAWLWLEFQNLPLSGGCCRFLLRYDNRNLIPQRID